VKPPRVLVVLLGAVAVIGVLFLFVLPGRTYLAQRRSLSAAATRVDALARANDQLDQHIKQLQTDAEVERLARQQFGLIKPGEIPYVILPPAQPVNPPAPPAPPRKHHRSLPSRLWRDVQFWS
jgi:cell division protein FtsB